MKTFNFFEKLWEHSRTLRRVGLVLVMCLMAIPQVWGYGSSAGTVVYFDMQDCSGFGTPYFRVGRTTALSRSYQLSLVGGTKYLYSYPLGQWDNYDAFSVANGKGWTGDDGNSTIYQPHSGQYENGNNKTGYDGDKIITKQTTFMSENISGNYYIKIGSATGSLSYNCQYYDRTNGSLPTYSISYDAPSNGTLTVQKYTGSTYTALASGTTGLKPTQIIKVTTSPSTHYGLASLTVTGATQIDGGDTYYITGNCTVTATFAPKWTIKGGNSNDTDGSDAMGDWATYNNLTYTGTANTYSGTITLAANTTYRFKVVDRDNGTPVYWGYGGSDAYHLTFLGQSGASQALGTNSDNKENLALMSAGAGTYTFTWNSSSKTLTVDFPTVTHPSTDYIYYKDYDNYDSHGDIVAHVWGGSTASTGDQRMPVVNSFNFDGTTYFYAALGNNTRAIFAGSDNTATYKTEDLNSASSKKGKFYDKSSNSSESTRWQPFTATLTLDHQGPVSNTPNPNSVTVTYGAISNINTDVISTRANKSNYTWGGYYTEPGGEGVQIINTSEKIPSNLEGYTSSGKWIKTGSSVSATIYAKWTQSIKLDDHGGTADGSATVAFNGTSMKDITEPTFAGYTVDGYYKESGCTNFIMAADGTLAASTDYTDAGGKWTRTSSAPTLHAHWKINPPTITNECNKITISTTAAGTTIYYTTDGSTPTNKSSVYDPSNKPTLASNTTVKAFATKSGCTDSEVATEVLSPVTTYSVNYNANLDGTSGSTASQTGHCQDDVVATSACGFSKDNYKFKWWNKSSAGTGEDFYPGEEVTFTSSANIPLYAQWEPVTSGWAYWVGDVAISSAGTAYDVTGNGVTMQITRESSADWNSDISQSYNQVSKYNSTTAKKAKVLAVDADNSYIEVNFKEGSTINDLYLGITSDQTSAQNFVVCYSTTADFSKGEYEFVKVGSTNNVVSVPGHDQATKSATRVKPSTADKYKYVRIYRKLTNGTGYNSTGGDLGCSNKARIYSIKAQAGSSCSAPAAPTISGTADYIVGQTLTLTADISGSNHDASTTYTWYKGANWATASASSPVQTAAVAGSNGHIFTKTAAVGDAGTYWCKASNGTGCESHNSTGKAITVAYQVTYAANGGTGDVMANSTGTSITLSANSYTAPSGYTFDGWRTVSDKQASGTDYAAGTSSITANLDLYAMWKQTVTLDDNGGTKDGSAVVYYNASSASTPSAPTYSGYTADGYYAEPGCTNLVMSTAGALTNYSGYVSGGKWVHSGATTLYAHYKCTAPTISCTDNVVTMSTTSTGATIYYTYTTDGSTPSDPTSSDNEYDSENKPVITKDTQFKAIAIESGKTSSAVTSQSCTYTAFSSSVNIEQAVLDNGTSWDYATALTSANITYDLSSGCTLDSLNSDCKKTDMNNNYLGLKIKASSKYIQINLKKGKTLKVRFGNRARKLALWINEVAQDSITNSGTYYTYELAADADNNRVVKIATPANNGTSAANVIKQIMIGEDIASVTLPAPITIADGITNGTISAASKANVGSSVTVTVTPSSGYELATLTYQACTGDPQNIDMETKQFTMPMSKVTLNATFVESCTILTAAGGTGSATVTGKATATLPYTLTNTTGVASVTVKVYEGSTLRQTYEGQTATTSGTCSATGLNAGTTYTYTVTPIGESGYCDGSESSASSEFTTQYGVTYDAGVTLTSGSVPTDANGYTSGADVTVLGNTGNMVYGSETFLGWTDGTTFYVADNKFTITANTTLTAVWSGSCSASGSSSTTDVTASGYTTYQEVGGSNVLFTSTPSLGFKYKDLDGNTINNSTDATIRNNAYSCQINSSSSNRGAIKTNSSYSNVDSISFYFATDTKAYGEVAVWYSTDNFSKDSTNLMAKTALASGKSNNEFYRKVLALPPVKKENDLTFKFRLTVNGTTGKIVYIDSLKVYTSSGSSTCFDVTFADGSVAPTSHTTWPDNLEGVPTGKKIVQTEDPTAIGYTFGGWYEDEDCTATEWSWSNPITENKTIYAKWTKDAYMFTGATDSNWSIATNWYGGSVPGINDDVYIIKPLTVDVDDAQAKSVVLMQDGSNEGSLSITAGKALVIAGTLSKTEDGSSLVATSAADVIINSTRAVGTGALIIGSEAGDNAATMNFETKAKLVGGSTVNQFIGSPFSNAAPYVDYGQQLYKFCPKQNGDRGWWQSHTSLATMTPFWGYNVLCTETSFLNLNWTGKLNPSESKTITDFYYNGSSETDNMFANSWTAPIHVGEIEDADLTNVSKTLYMFNAGTPAQEAGHSGADATNSNDDPGTYISIPIHSATYAGIGVIPSMQAFYVLSTGSGASITLDYNKIVYTPALTSVGIVPNRAPKHNAEVVEPEVIKLHVQSETGWGANTYVLGRADFAEGYEDGWDGAYIEGESATPKLYTPSIDGNMFINCLPEIEGTVVGFRKGSSDNNYIFSFDYDGDEVWYLNDQKAQKSTQIMNGQTYAFVSEAGDNAARFVISATPINKIATGCESVGAEAAKVRKLIINDKVYIIRGGQVFDVLGKTIKK